MEGPFVTEEPEQDRGIVMVLDTIQKTQGLPTRKEAHEQRLCVMGHPVTQQDWDATSPAGKREYAISGMCEKCFDKLFAD